MPTIPPMIPFLFLRAPKLALSFVVKARRFVRGDTTTFEVKGVAFLHEVEAVATGARQGAIVDGARDRKNVTDPC